MTGLFQAAKAAKRSHVPILNTYNLMDVLAAKKAKKVDDSAAASQASEPKKRKKKEEDEEPVYKWFEAFLMMQSAV